MHPSIINNNKEQYPFIFKAMNFSGIKYVISNQIEWLVIKIFDN